MKVWLIYRDELGDNIWYSTNELGTVDDEFVQSSFGLSTLDLSLVRKEGTLIGVAWTDNRVLERS